MSFPSRRGFLGTSICGLAAGQLLAQDKGANAAKTPPTTAAKIARIPDDPPFQPSTLFLTWQRDPTTTITVQWIGTAGETADTTVAYTPVGADTWQAQPPAVKPYPLTDVKVFRAELTGLKPATDYQFRIGKASPVYRFRTPYVLHSSRDYHLSLHRIEGAERFHLALDEHGRVMDVCRTGQRKSGLIRASN